MKKRVLGLIGIVAAIALGLGLLSRLVAEILWFQEVGFTSVFLKRIVAKGVIGALVTGVSALFLFGNLAIAERLKYPGKKADPTSFDQVEPPIAYNSFPEAREPKEFYRDPMRFRSLLPLAIGLSLLMGILLFRYSQTLTNLWTFNQLRADISPPMPAPFRIAVIWQAVQQFFTTPVLQVGALARAGFALAGAIALLVYPYFWLRAIGVGLSLGFGYLMAHYWARFLLAVNATPFGTTDPIFSRDLRWFVFWLPVGQLLEFWLFGLFLFGLITILLTYLLSGNSLSQGKFVGFTSGQRQHIQALLACIMLLGCLRFWLNRYELLYSPEGVVYGLGFSDRFVLLPAFWVLIGLAAAIALFLGWQAFRPHSLLKQRIQVLLLDQFASTRWLLTLFFGVFLISTGLLPLLVQTLIVQPNELERETPYLRHNIAYTRQAFGLDAIEVETFNPQGDLTYKDLQTNDETVRNIRLWDARPLLKTNRQLQQIRPYYRFPDADIDRYTLVPTNPGSRGDQQQVLIAARELDYPSVPQEAQTWLNEHLVYTHGYGFTMSPVNQVATGGLPDYFVKDLGSADSKSGLTVSSERIRASIPIGQPRIYYGEITNTYVMTGTEVQELDYPVGNENAYNVYDGRGGINIGNPLVRSLLAYYLRDWRMIFARSFTPNSKLLFRRNINERVQAIAPFLRFDRDPYPVLANVNAPPTGGAAGSDSGNYLYWIIDAYTTSDRYPYAEPAQKIYSDIDDVRPFNYIRNSVKIIIDAYHGSVDFYVSEPNDPLIRSWQKIFPEMFKPLDAMPPALRSHIRYPVDLYEAQSERLLTYHMTDPQVFYNREDLWQIPTEIYGNKPQLVEPYFLIIQLPQQQSSEFISILPFTPNQRTNLTAWLAARSDGDNYGKSLLYVFPKQQLIFGPEQIEARINQDPVISQQISLWNRQGSSAIQGNLLVIPIENSLLYVEPLYLEAEQNSLPTLVRVIVVFENRIVMAETLEQSLRAIFQPDQTAPAIVRPVE